MCSIIYFIVGFVGKFKNFLLFILVGILQALIGMMVGIFLGAVSPDVQAATEIAPMIFIPFMLFCGFLVNVKNIIAPFKVFEFISPLRYTFEFFIRNEFEYATDLGDVNPLKTLNFYFDKNLLIFILLMMLGFYVIVTGISIKFTTNQIMN